jgi:hypothetical protein
MLIGNRARAALVKSIGRAPLGKASSVDFWRTKTTSFAAVAKSW